jgi:hypothetical protein
MVQPLWIEQSSPALQAGVSTSFTKVAFIISHPNDVQSDRSSLEHIPLNSHYQLRFSEDTE